MSTNPELPILPRVAIAKLKAIAELLDPLNYADFICNFSDFVAGRHDYSVDLEQLRSHVRLLSNVGLDPESIRVFESCNRVMIDALDIQEAFHRESLSPKDLLDRVRRYGPTKPIVISSEEQYDRLSNLADSARRATKSVLDIAALIESNLASNPTRKAAVPSFFPAKPPAATYSALDDNPGDCEVGSPVLSDKLPNGIKPKRSTQPGEARDKIIAALTKHHEYSSGNCFKPAPISVSELSRQADVGKATASSFFKENFEKGYIGYKYLCNRDAGKLARSIELLRGETTPKELMNRERYLSGKRIDDE